MFLNTKFILVKIIYIYANLDLYFFNPEFVEKGNFLPWFKTIFRVNFKLI